MNPAWLVALETVVSVAMIVFVLVICSALCEDEEEDELYVD